MSVLALPELDLNHEQQMLVEALERILQPDQALWLGGYFTALGRSGGKTADARTDPAQPQAAARPTAAPRPFTILFGSETGNCASLARSAAASARDAGLQPSVIDMADYKVRALKDEQDLLIITSTHGEGDPPQSAKPFFEFLGSRKAPKLAGKRFVVVALGDSTYEHYCAAGRHLDRRLEELGATRLAPCTDCDVDYEDVAADAIAAALAALKPRQMAVVDAPLRSGAPSAFLATPNYDKRHPFIASVLDNFVLTGRGSSKETRHIELSLEGSGLAFDPGDALGVLPRNDPRLVDAILERIALFADIPVTVKDRTMMLGEAMARFFEIAQATPRFIDHWAELSDAGELRALRGEDRAEARALFLRDHHVIDIVRRFPVRGIDAQTFIAGLRPLQPRLYSIASSQAMAPDEVHLTISTLRYDLRGERRTGVTSGFCAERVEPGTGVPVHIQSNPHFRLPNDDVAILMIGAGTGVAPYRAFLQEREARAACGKSWLVFGERNFRTDFLYQTEWQDHLKSGVLSRMNVAFSRDRLPKTYVQHRLLEHSREVYAWLEEGAHLYVCGDASNLAPDVHAALRAIVEQERGRGGLATQDYLDALQRDRRYHIDVY
jgi:sulfite reductase (NADPH) flavoprotein alpha-component